MSAKTKSVLRPIGTATIEASKTAFDPHAAIATRQGLYVWDGFIERVRKHASPMESMEALALPYSDLDEDANDSQIGAALGQGYEFSASKLCYVIDRLIARQPNGEDGVLLANMHVNLFYTENGFVVRVDWLADYGEWLVGAWLCCDVRRRRGLRAFRN